MNDTDYDLIVYTDGGSRGNPGPAGIGVYVTNIDGEVVLEHKVTIGTATNNVAEYEAVKVSLQILAKKYGKRTKDMKVLLRLDSELVKKQLNAEYQIKDEGLMPIFFTIHNLRVASFPQLSFEHVRREFNKEADRLVNEALDEV
jgi:ribonuclease HI